jgi:hypothetical protein
LTQNQGICEYHVIQPDPNATPTDLNPSFSRPPPYPPRYGPTIPEFG